MADIRTSLTHPLRIDRTRLGPGTLSLTFCPGKRQAAGLTGAWRRDLDLDLDQAKASGVGLLISLVEEGEMAALGVSGLGEGLRKRGIEWLHLPFRDGAAPGADWEKLWAEASPRIHRALDDGGHVLVHCKGGIERAPTVAALLRIERGESLKQALETLAEARPGIAPLPEQMKFLRRRAGLETREAARIRASLLGGAMGDALGAKVEFWNLEKILTHYPAGVRVMIPAYGRRAPITDDTQMTLFTAEGLIQDLAGQAAGEDPAPVEAVHRALLRWFATQEGRERNPQRGGGICADPRLQALRAPGGTCLSALAARAALGEPARNDSKGCGTIMRVAPVGLFGGPDLRDLALETSALTHGHPTGQEAAAFFAELLDLILQGEDLEPAIRRLRLRTSGETRAAVERALAAPRDGGPQTVESVGAGWIAEEALAIALYAALCAESFERGLVIAVTHGGDSDSTGAIAGNLLGLLFPEEVLSHPWRGEVECADLVLRLAEGLARGRVWIREPGAHPELLADLKRRRLV